MKFVDDKGIKHDLLFIDLDHPDKFSKIIFDALLLVSSEGDSLENLYVWISSKMDLRKVKWSDMLVPEKTGYFDQKKVMKSTESYKYTINYSENSEFDKEEEENTIRTMKDDYWDESNYIVAHMN